MALRWINLPSPAGEAPHKTMGGTASLLQHTWIRRFASAHRERCGARTGDGLRVDAQVIAGFAVMSLTLIVIPTG